MKLFKKIIIATGTLFGLALSLSLLQRKTLLLAGKIEFLDDIKFEDLKELTLKKDYTIRKVSGNNEGFKIYRNNQVFFETSEKNSLSAFGLHLSSATYKVAPISRSKKSDSSVIIELVEE
ncbi:MAG: hypothetical protein JXR51_06985 [Bacteroidales bacterium]|nr:hypothetical protein [Bacteroidales bacterium]MBN2756907.1 hypothetical protein [Bacteroidales bacterium]